MPYNGSGVFSLDGGNPVSEGNIIQSKWANDTLSDLAGGLSNAVTRDGQGKMINPLTIISGTNTQPGLAFTNETATGFYKPGDGIAAFTAKGVEVFRYNNAGRVLIGTTTDNGSDRLQVAGSVAVTGSQSISSNLGVSGNASITGTLSVAGGISGALTGITNLTTTGNTILGDAVGDTLNVAAGSLQVNASGNVGVGMTPVRKLDVSGSIGATGGIANVQSGITTTLGVDGSGSYLEVQGANNLRFYTNGGERIKIDGSTGNVGIGASTVYEKLDVVGGIHANTTNADAGAYIQALGTSEASYAGGAKYSSYSSPNYVYLAKATAASGIRTVNGGLVLWGNAGLTAGNTFNSTPLVNVTSGGSVGIGVTPSNLLHLSAAAGATLVRWSDTTNGTLGFIGSGDGILSTATSAMLAIRAESALVFGAGGNAERLRIDAGGRTLVNRTGDSGLGTFQVSGISNDIADLSAAGNVRLRLRSTNSNGAASLMLQNATSGTSAGNGYEIALSTDGVTGTHYLPSGGFQWSPSGSGMMYLTSTGLGIGAGATPARALHVKSTAEIVRLETTTARGGGQGYMSINDPSGVKGYWGFGGSNDDLQFVNQMNSTMSFWTNGIQRMTIAAAGAATFASTVSATGFTGPLTGAVTGNASTATALQTARTINGTSFDGTGNITVTAAAGTLTGSTLAAGVTASSLTSVAGSCTVGGLLVGYRGTPAASVTTGAFVAADAGKCVYATAGVTVPNSTMAADDVVLVRNTTGSSITITATITTLRQSGTANTGNRTLLPYGVCSIQFQSGTVAYISGDIT